MAGAQNRRTMVPADILRVSNVGDAQISPNGEWVVYAVGSVSGDQTRSTLWLARAGQTSGVNQPQASERRLRNPPTPLLPPDWNASNARWSPDSTTIAFLANRDGANGIWITSVNRREPRFVAALQSSNFFITYSGEALSWAPDSKRIAYISATELLDSNVEEGAGNDPRVINRIQYKSRTSFSDNRRTHVWIVDITKPEPRQLTSGAFYDHAVTFSPRGNEIAFLSNHEPDPDANNNSDIFAVDINGEVRQITQTRGCEYEPVWSPDGNWIAYTATKREVTTIDSIAEDAHAWVTSASGDERREVSAELDRRVRSPRWDRESRRSFFLAGDSGNTTVYRVSVNGGKVYRLDL